MEELSLPLTVTGDDLGEMIRALESLKAGRRLPEARFGNLKVASKGQPSVFGAFARRATAPP